MGTEFLRPQDCLIQRIRVTPTACSRRKYGNGSFNPSYYYYYHNNNNNNNNNNSGNGRFNKKPVQRKRVGSERSISKRSRSADDLKSVRNKVTVLRGGESMDRKVESEREDRSAVTGTDPEMAPKKIRKADVYAGSGFSVSPAPSSLPLPSFSKKKPVPIDDSATRDLRRLLRLDL